MDRVGPEAIEPDRFDHHGAGGACDNAGVNGYGVLTVTRFADPSGNVGTGSTLIRVLNVGDTTAPTVALTSPEDSAELTYLHDVVGSVLDDNLYTWRVSMRFMGEADEQVVLEGASQVNDDVLGQLDTTQLINGLYILRLYVLASRLAS